MLRFLFPECKRAFGEVEAFGGALLGAVGAILFAEVERDFVGVHFGGALFFGLSTFFFGAGDVQAFSADMGGLFAVFCAGGEIGETLEGEELVRGVVVFGDEDVGGGHDGVVDFFGGAVLAARTTAAGGDGVELGEGEFLARSDPGVDEIEAVLLFVQAHERAVGGEVEVESAFGTWFADAFADSVVGLALDVAGELFEFDFGERSEGGLES